MWRLDAEIYWLIKCELITTYIWETKCRTLSYSPPWGPMPFTSFDRRRIMLVTLQKNTLLLLVQTKIFTNMLISHSWSGFSDRPPLELAAGKLCFYKVQLIEYTLVAIRKVKHVFDIHCIRFSSSPRGPLLRGRLRGGVEVFLTKVVDGHLSPEVGKNTVSSCSFLLFAPCVCGGTYPNVARLLVRVPLRR